MQISHRLLAGLLGLTVTSLAGAAEPEIPGPLGKPGKLLFEDRFERGELGPWKVVIPGFKVDQGMLIATQDRADHGSVGRVHLPMKDLVMTFRFRLAGSPRFNVVFDDKRHKGSHAGHIARVAFAARQIRLGDDKEGIMRNDIFKLRRNPETKSAADKLIAGRGTAIRADLRQNRWYDAKIEIVGDEMRVSLDGEPIGHLKSPGLAHPTKESVHFTVSGNATHFDDVKIWNVDR